MSKGFIFNSNGMYCRFQHSWVEMSMSATQSLWEGNCAEPTGVTELRLKGIWKDLVLGISLLVSPFPSCFSLTIELSCSLEDRTSNDLLRKMGTGYNSHHCGIAETLECLTDFPTPWNSLYLNSFEARS